MNRIDAMGKVILFFLTLTLLFSCNEQPKNPVAEYGDSLIGAYKSGQKGGETANLDAVKKTVEMYHATHDKYPQNLSEIKDLISANIDLSHYEYNPGNGSVSLKQ
jgi:hypothetical protein